ncbi:MAG TPA: PAS domain-containing protein [Gaiellaceae bacterium]|nr:PAS domain-containing protein [Gaiellaceae bacterium]
MESARHSEAAFRRELQVRLEQQRLVADLGQTALSDAPLRELLDAATANVAAGLSVEFASLVERVDGDGLIVRSVFGWPADMLDSDVLPGGASSQAGYTLLSGGSVVLADAATERRFAISTQAREHRIRSGISTPIGSNGSTYGVLSAHTPVLRGFSQHDVTFLESVAHVLSIALRRRASEEELERAHRLFETVIEGTTDCVFVKDRDGRLLTLNEPAAEVFGAPRAELLGRALHEILPAKQAEAMLETDRFVLERGTVATFEERIPLEPEPRVYLSTKGPYRAGDGTILGTFGIARDVTERIRREEELRAATEYADRLIETSNAIVIVLDTKGDILTFNKAAEEITGYSRDEVIGGNWDVLLPRDRFPEVWLEFDRLVDIGAPERYENPILTKTGEERTILWQNSQMRDGDGEVVGTVSFGIDVTATVEAKEHAEELAAKLRQAEKLEALGQLAGGVAHDFNNLLLAIRGRGECALAALADGRDASDDLDAILAAADHAADLTRQLLAFGRRQVLSPETVDLGDVVCDTVAMLERVLAAPIELRTESCGRPLPVRADRSQLVQVITNLALNARDAMPHGGVLSIETEDDGADSAVLRVRDEGVGIDSSTAARIFEPFFTTKGEQGNGLGLATVYGIVAQTGGEVSFESTPGRGTTFTVTLPLDASGRLAAAPASGQDGAGDGSEKILLVEDDPTVRQVVTAMLSSHGYDVTPTASGSEAIAAFRERTAPIDLVLTDLIMRGLDGPQTVSEIRALDPDAKVLYMSGYSNDVAIRNGELEAGTAFIQKPFSGETLASYVRRLLDAA